MSDIMSEVKGCLPPFNFNPDLSKIQSPFIAPPEPVYRNPNEGLERLVEEQTAEIEKIRYENMKLNAQIQTLNVTVDSKDEVIDDLRASVDMLTQINNSLLESNKHALRDGVIIGMVPMLLSVVLSVILTYLGVL